MEKQIRTCSERYLDVPFRASMHHYSRVVEVVEQEFMEQHYTFTTSTDPLWHRLWGHVVP